MTVRSPVAAVERVELTERSAGGRRVEVTVAVRNPNDMPLRVWGVDYRIELADASGDGEFRMIDRPAITLPPYGEQTIVLPAAFATAGGSPRDAGVAGVGVRGHVIYDAPGHIRARMTDLGVPRPAARFRREPTVE